MTTRSAATSEIPGMTLPPDVARVFVRRWSTLLGSAVEVAPSSGERSAEGPGVLLSGLVRGDGGAFKAWIDGPLALALAGPLAQGPVETLDDAARVLVGLANETAETLAEALGIRAGAEGVPITTDATPTGAPQQQRGARGWFLVGIAEVKGQMVLDLEALESQASDRRPSEVLLDLELPFTVTLGSIELTLGEIQQLEAGSVVPLGRGAEGPVQLVVGGRVIARGELVVVDDCFGIRIASVEPHERRLSSLGRV